MLRSKTRITFLTNVRPQWRRKKSCTETNLAIAIPTLYMPSLKCCVCPSIVRVYTKYDFAYTEIQVTSVLKVGLMSDRKTYAQPLSWRIGCCWLSNCSFIKVTNIAGAQNQMLISSTRNVKGEIKNSANFILTFLLQTEHQTWEWI